MSNDLFGDNIALHGVRQRPINQSAYNTIASRLNRQAGLTNNYEPHMTEEELGTAMDMESSGAPLFSQGRKTQAVLPSEEQRRIQERQDKIIDYVSEWKSTSEVTNHFKAVKSTVHNDLRALLEAGKVERKHGPRGASLYRAATLCQVEG